MGGGHLYVDININEIVKVRLTDAGKKHLEKYFNKIKENLKNQHGVTLKREDFREIDGEIFRCQLWELMHIFGPQCHMGADTMFVDNKININMGAD